jgi:hypothetical protein
VATLVARNANLQAMVTPMVGLGGGLQTGGWFCDGAFGRNMASIAAKMFHI